MFIHYWFKNPFTAGQHYCDKSTKTYKENVDFSGAIQFKYPFTNIHLTHTQKTEHCGGHFNIKY